MIVCYLTYNSLLAFNFKQRQIAIELLNNSSETYCTSSFNIFFAFSSFHADC